MNVRSLTFAASVASLLFAFDASAVKPPPPLNKPECFNSPDGTPCKKGICLGQSCQPDDGCFTKADGALCPTGVCLSRRCIEGDPQCVGKPSGTKCDKGQCNGGVCMPSPVTESAFEHPSGPDLTAPDHTPPQQFNPPHPPGSGASGGGSAGGVAGGPTGGAAAAMAAGAAGAASATPVSGDWATRSVTMKDGGEAAVLRLSNALKDVNAKLTEATNTHDAVKLTCVNEVLKQLKAVAGIATTSNNNLQTFIAGRKESEADQEYTKVMTAQNIGLNLRAESEKCLGELAFQTAQNLKLIVDLPKDLPAGDLAKYFPPNLTTSYGAPGSP